MLAKISLGINAILIVAVVVLFVKSPSGTAGEVDADDSSLVTIPDNGELTIAYYNSDSLSTQSDFVVDLQEQIQLSTTKAQDRMAGKEREIQRWQQSWEEKGSLMPREEQKYMEEAQTKQMEIAQFEQNLNMEVQMEQEKLMITLYMRLQNYAKTFCQKNEIDMLVSFQMGQNVIYMNPQFDVTSQFLNHVNAEYNSTFEDEAEEEGVE